MKKIKMNFAILDVVIFMIAVIACLPSVHAQAEALYKQVVNDYSTTSTDTALKSLLPQSGEIQNETIIPNIAKSGVEYNTLYFYYYGYYEPVTIYTTKFEGDTIIDGKEYVKVYENDLVNSPDFKLDGYIREENNGKVFFRSDRWGNNEYLLYDFGMQVGDSIRYYYWGVSEDTEIYVKLDSITDEYIGGAIRRCHHITATFIDVESHEIYFIFYNAWVEGIGSLHGPMYPVDDWSYALLCYKEDDTLVYINEEFNDCEYGFSDGFIEESSIMNNADFKVYPNPANDVITIESNDNQIIRDVAIYNIDGQLLRYWNSNEVINVKDIDNGVYIIEICTDNDTYHKKVIIAR